MYFDGYLPPSKRSVRGERLQTYTRQLNGYHEAWPQNIPPRLAPVAHAVPVELFSPKSVPAGLSKIPAAPFLVPAIIEALSQSAEYRDITQVVPGEAELYCAQYLRQHGGCVLTSDSDLLAHELGPEGSVSFLKDVFQVSTRGVMSLRAIQYRTSAIVERLGLPVNHGLRSLAYEIFLDVHGTFPQLLQRAVKLEAVNTSKNTYAEFCIQYMPLQLEENREQNSATKENSSEDLVQLLRTLDPRISEYVLQFPTFASIVKLSSKKLLSPCQDRTQIEVFMPFLLDCPIKTSAWEMSTVYRQLAYALLNLVVPPIERIATVVENRRQQNIGGGREWQLPTTDQMAEACQELLDLIHTMRKSAPMLSTRDLWSAMALQQDLQWSTGQGKKSLGATLINQHKGSTTARVNWDTVHLMAQLHGSYYSLRMIQQILGIVYKFAGTIDLPQAVVQLHDELGKLPCLGELMSIDDTLVWLCSPDSFGALEVARSRLGIGSPKSEASKAIKKKEKKKRKREGLSNSSEAASKRPANMFELLADS